MERSAMGQVARVVAKYGTLSEQGDPSRPPVPDTNKKLNLLCIHCYQC